MARMLNVLILALLAGFGPGCHAPGPKFEACPSAGDQAIADVLRPILQKYKLPALGGAIITASGDLTIGVVGVRKAHGGDPVTLDDLWHIGSCGKAMHATLVARLVEQGKLDWNTTVAEVFPDLAPALGSKLGTVTVAQLLSHHAGLPRDADYDRLRRHGPPAQQRWQALKRAGAKALVSEPGTTYSYSNLGYTISGAIIEKVTGSTYEDAMRQGLFAPLGLTSAIFESAELVGVENVPWSHDDKGRPIDQRKLGFYDPPALRPAGCMRFTLRDWAKFVLHHLHAARSDTTFLSAASYAKLHTSPFGDDYALGWAVCERGWGGGAVLSHTGSNGFNFSTVWIAPKRGFAVLVCANQNCPAATDEAAGALIGLHFRSPP